MFSSIIELLQSAVSFVTSAVEELFSILSLTKQLSDLISSLLGSLGF